MGEFKYQDMFQLNEDKTEYRLITKDGVAITTVDERDILSVDPECLTRLAKEAMHDISHLFRKSHLERFH